nr:hypothetical protein [uncultured Holophaga sp.]
MNLRPVPWIVAPIALSLGVLWLSAQESKGKAPEGVKIPELAEKLQEKEKDLVKKEAELAELQQRLSTLQGTLDKDRTDLENREKTLKEGLARLEDLKLRPPVDPQLVRTTEAMDPAAGAKSIKEMAAINIDLTTGLIGAMTPKKAAKLMDQVALLDAPLAGRLMERVAKSRQVPPAKS